MNIALATCAVLPEHDPDERPLLDALRGAGHHAETLAWDAPGSDASAFDAVVLRATWNYYESYDRFSAWLDKTEAETKILNPLFAVRWNIAKTYLRELAASGVPVIPTEWAMGGSAVQAERVFANRGWDEIVIKPVVGAGSHLTERFGRSDTGRAQAFLAEHAGRDMMIQRYMPSVATHGERSVVWIDGRFTHAVHKHPRFAGEEEKTEPAELTPELVEFSESVLKHAPSGLLYARVDVIQDDDASPMLSELELIEPSLYFDYGGPASLAQMVSALETRLQAAGV